MHFRQLMLFYSQKGKKNLCPNSQKKKNNKKMCAVYGDGIVTDSTVRKQFTKFRNVNVDLEGIENSQNASCCV